VADFDKLWNFGDPAGTEAKFRALLPEAERAWSAGDRAELLTQIARTQGLQRRFDEAHRTLDEAERWIGSEDGVAGTRFLLERGRVFNSSGEKAKARPLFLLAWTTAANDTLAVDAAHMVANVESGEAALEWNRKAVARAEASSEPGAQGWLGSLYNNIGWTWHGMGRYADALAMFERALAWRRPRGPASQVSVARWCVARCLRSLGRVDEALGIQRELEREIEEGRGDRDGYVPEEIGECLLALGRADEARPHFAVAHGILSKDPWFCANEPKRLERLAELGRAG